MIKRSFVICLTSTDSLKRAENIAQKVVGKKLAACINILPRVTSIYSWKNKIEKSREWILMIKTQKKWVKKLEKEILDIHSYETPEFVVCPVTSGNKKYLEWVFNTTTPNL